MACGMQDSSTQLKQRKGAGKISKDSDQKEVGTTDNAQPSAKPVWSSTVLFYPPSQKYWRIGGKWYDFADFLDKHPGGAEVLKLARDRFEDCTYVFEAHHHNYPKVRAMIRKYEVPEEQVKADGLLLRPKGSCCDGKGHQDSTLDAQRTPKLLRDEAFYSVLRRRVTAYLREAGHPAGDPTLQSKILFFIIMCVWTSAWAALLTTGHLFVAILTGMASALVGAFGHNWVHQPHYKYWAFLSMETIGMNSSNWLREHVLQHHMYTNSPWDNHFTGTAPFIVTDPTVERNWLQAKVFPYINPLILCFGIYANYVSHTIELLKGGEVFNCGKFIFPLQIGLLVWNWGYYGLLLHLGMNSALGVWYFTLALMNHNAEHCLDVDARNTSEDWAVAQLHVSADWSVGSSFLSAGRYLWLNFHTVHHLFPLVDFSHHPAIQSIMVDTCAEFGILYQAGDPCTIWKEMIRSFASPRVLLQEVLVYAGGL